MDGTAGARLQVTVVAEDCCRAFPALHRMRSRGAPSASHRDEASTQQSRGGADAPHHSGARRSDAKRGHALVP